MNTPMIGNKMLWAWNCQSAMPSKFNQVKPKANLSSIINFVWDILTLVRQFCRKKRIEIWMVPHPCDPWCCDWSWHCWLYILQIQASGMSERIQRTTFSSIFTCKQRCNHEHFLFPIAVLHGFRDYVYHVTIHATWQQPEHWNSSRIPAITTWHSCVR